MASLKNQVDNYIQLAEQEKDLYEQYKSVKKAREALRDSLANELDSIGVKRQMGTGSSSVTVTSGDQNYVEEFEDFKGWCRMNGLFDELVKEVPNMRKLNAYIKKGGDLPAGVKRDKNKKSF